MLGFQSLAPSDAKLIRNYILPARAWVEHGGPNGGGNGSGIAPAAFSRSAAMRAQSDLEKAQVLQGEPVAKLDTSMHPWERLRFGIGPLISLRTKEVKRLAQSWAMWCWISELCVTPLRMTAQINVGWQRLRQSRMCLRKAR